MFQDKGGIIWEQEALPKFLKCPQVALLILQIQEKKNADKCHSDDIDDDGSGDVMVSELISHCPSC